MEGRSSLNEYARQAYHPNPHTFSVIKFGKMNWLPFIVIIAIGEWTNFFRSSVVCFFWPSSIIRWYGSSGGPQASALSQFKLFPQTELWSLWIIELSIEKMTDCTLCHYVGESFEHPLLLRGNNHHCFTNFQNLVFCSKSNFLMKIYHCFRLAICNVVIDFHKYLFKFERKVMVSMFYDCDRLYSLKVTRETVLFSLSFVSL